MLLIVIATKNSSTLSTVIVPIYNVERIINVYLAKLFTNTKNINLYTQLYM